MKIKIYLLPGTMCDENIWSKFYTFFDENYELIHVPIPMKSNLDEIIKALDIYFEEEKINLLGFSLGGYIASYFACNYPHRIKKLFVVSSSLSILAKGEIQKRQKAISFINSHGFKGLGRKKIISLLEEKNQEDEGLIHLISQMYINLGKEVFINQMKSTLVRNDLLEKISSLNFPITFFYCKEDRLVNHEWLEVLSKRSKDISFVRKISSSHMVPLEKPFELSQALKEWIK